MEGVREALLATTIERAPVPIYLLDRAGRFAYLNDAAARCLGGHEALIGSRAISRVHPDDRRALLRAMRAGDRAELRVEALDGSFRTILLCAVDLRREVGFYVLSHHDVTALRSTERMLASLPDASLDSMLTLDERGRVVAWTPRATETFGWSEPEAIGKRLATVLVPKDLRGHGARPPEPSSGPGDPTTLQARSFRAQKLEALGSLAAGIAHDFNNIISAIETFASLAIPHVSGQVRDDLDQVLKATSRATCLTRQLFTFARQDDTAAAVLDVSARIRDLAPMLERLVGGEIALLLELASGAPCVRLAPAQLEQVVVNLVVNARDAMPAGGTLSLRVEARASSLVLRVSDTGVGIAEPDKARLFEPFFTTKTQSRGAGLGLSIVAGIVTKAGGTISVDSVLGEGTSFEICFPAVHEREAPLLTIETKPPHRENEDRPGETVLLVEDDDLVRQACLRALDSAGYRVFEAHNAGEAIILAEDETRVDIMVTDIALPRIDGNALARHMGRIHPETKVLFVSGYNESDARVSEARASRMPFLAKPFTPQALLSKVRETLRLG